MLYLCSRFENRTFITTEILIVLLFKITKKMKKLVLALAVIASVSMISCTNNAEQATEAAEETVEAVEETVDSAAAVVDSAAAVVDSAAQVVNEATEAPAE